MLPCNATLATMETDQPIGLIPQVAMAIGDRGILFRGSESDLPDEHHDAEHRAELAYRIGFNPMYLRIFGGKNMESGK